VKAPPRPEPGEGPSIPCLPENAPFTAEQRAYLNGFLAGLFSRTSAALAPGLQSAPPATPLDPLTILYGSQTGTAEKLAKRIAKEAGRYGFAATIYELAAYPTAQLASERNVLVITSTYGDGEPPDNGKAFWEFLQSPQAPQLAQTRFSVCALGDSNYPKFCAFGRNVDERLAALSATRAHPRVDCDVDFEGPFATWLGAALRAIRPSPTPSTPAASAPVIGHETSDDAGRPGYERKRPVPARFKANCSLNGAGSAKDTRHFEFVVDAPGWQYTAGDAFGVWPQNCPGLVHELVQALGARGTETVPRPEGGECSLQEALLTDYEITRIPAAFLQAMAAKTSDAGLTRLTQPGINGELTQFLRGREIIDLLLGFPAAPFTPDEFVRLLRRLSPRLYSIASSPSAHAGEVHLCVGVVRYLSLGRTRQGVCSTFLAERAPADSTVPVFLHANPNFRLPADGATPIIMVGPGTGIAPFRGFLHERRARGAKGAHWLFFGEQCAATDFLYQEELLGMKQDGVLARLDTAFSRDQAEKIYVQHRMLEQAGELFAWLENGAHFYVCGDAARMAKDVDAALHQVVQTAGGRTREQAEQYVATLKTAKRYQRDVY